MDERLKKFARLVEKNSFTKAAADLHISQPALSITIKNLESELKVQLLVRDGKQLKTTPAGKLVYDMAKELEDQVHNLRLKLAELSKEEQPISIGMIDSIAEAVFVHNDGFARLSSQTSASLRVDNSLQLITAVEQGEIDIAFITKQTRALPGTLDVQIIGTEPLVIVTHPSQSTSIKRDIRKGIITNFISYNQTSTTDQLLKRVLIQKGIDVHTIFYSTSPEVILQLVLSGRGTAALPYMMVEELLHERVLIPVFVGGSCIIDRDICMVRRKNRQLPKPITDIVKHVQETIKSFYADSATMKTE